MTTTAAREHWSSRIGFILVAAGSAVGLGNIWKFPFEAGSNGGGAFLIIYLAIVFSIGLAVMTAEILIGRTAQRNPAGALKLLKGGPWPAVGYLGILTAFVILSFYVVVAGWTVAYIVKLISGTISGSDPDALGAAFGGFIGDPVEPVLYAAFFMAVTAAVVISGVRRGIERAGRVLMPLLFLIIVLLAVRAMTLPGAAEGLAFFLQPDFSAVTTGTVVAALGTAFFSLSLGMGTMITYGSYLKPTENVPSAALSVVVLDTSVAVLAGLAILPAVFAFGADPAAGPGLTFITLPGVFAQMPGGAWLGPLFFVLLAIAALTSAVSIMEPVTAYLIDELSIDRRTATLGVAGAAFLLSIPSSLSMGLWADYTLFGKGFLDLMDFLATNITLPLGGLLISVFAGWIAHDRLCSELNGPDGGVRRFTHVWAILVKFVAPAAIAIILIDGLTG